MMQADTFWADDLFNKLLPILHKLTSKYDVIFDRAGSQGPQRDLIAGGYFYVSSNTPHQFFDKTGKSETHTMKYFHE